MRSVKLKIEEGMTDEEIKQVAGRSMNGAYTVEICRGCHAYKMSPEGSLTNAIIVKHCRECVSL